MTDITGRPEPRNLVLAWRNRLADAVLTGGSWTGLDNLKTHYIGQTASSTSLDPEDTQFTATWSEPQVGDLAALLYHNLSVTGVVRMLFSRDGEPVFDTTSDAWPAWPFGTIPFGDPRWWLHRPVAEDIEGFSGQWAQLLPQLTIWDQLQVWITDPDNEQGFVDLPYLFAGPALQVSVNYDRSDVWGYQEADAPDLADYGTPVGSDDQDPRVFKCTLSHMPHDEALAGLGSLMAYAGRGRRPFVVLPDPGDTYNMHRRVKLGFWPRRPELETVRRATRRASLEIWEWLA
jgi:hypothetical protein